MNCKYCGSRMDTPGGEFKNSPYQNKCCSNISCQARNYNGTWYTKEEYAAWIESTTKD